MSPSFQKLLRRTKTTYQLLWFALTTQLPLFAVIPYTQSMMAGDGVGDALIHKSNVTGNSGLFLPLLVVAGMCFFLSLMFGKRYNSPEFFERLSLRTASEPSVVLPEDITEPERIIACAMRTMMLPMLIRLILGDFIAAMGLTVALADGAPARVIPFIGLALASNVLAFPRLDLLAARLLPRIRANAESRTGKNTSAVA